MCEAEVLAPGAAVLRGACACGVRAQAPGAGGLPECVFVCPGDSPVPHLAPDEHGVKPEFVCRLDVTDRVVEEHAAPRVRHPGLCHSRRERRLRVPCNVTHCRAWNANVMLQVAGWSWRGVVLHSVRALLVGKVGIMGLHGRRGQEAKKAHGGRARGGKMYRKK